MTDYLTTRELAALLRVKERKVYDLAAKGAVPCSRATGKLLFPRSAVEAWLAQDNASNAPPAPTVFLGSHDPLLDWALRESACGIATYFDGSEDGLDRFIKAEGVATGLHLYDGPTGAWNVPAVSKRCAGMPAVLVEWARRERGLVLSPALKGKVKRIADFSGHRIVPRQQGAGTQRLLEHLLAEAGLKSGAQDFTSPARTESDAAVAVLEGKADGTLGLRALAEQYRLDFVPVIEERFDLLMLRSAYFEPPMQTFLAFCRSKPFQARAREMAGYDTSGLGTVHWNAA